MPGGKTYYLDHAFLNMIMKNATAAVLNASPWSASTANIYMALFYTAPTAATINTGVVALETGYTGYARKQIVTGNMRVAGAVVNGQISNLQALVFDACTANGSNNTIIAFGIVDSSSGTGNLLYWGTITSKTIDTNNTPATVGVDALVITEA